MPLVRATEAGIARTEGFMGNYETIVVAEHLGDLHSENWLEYHAIEGDSPLRCVADVINCPQVSSLPWDWRAKMGGIKLPRLNTTHHR